MFQHGITGMQITGWNLGGQDQNNPSHDTDPLLGTWEELRDAIAAIRKIGVKVILFAKFTYADRATKEFRETYRSMAVTDPYGDYQVFDGYRYQTRMALR
jgi:glycosidase